MALKEDTQLLPSAVLQRLALTYLYIFFAGVPVILLTRLLFVRADPQYYLHSVPTISRTASTAVTYGLFSFGMGSVAVCIVICWILTWRMHRARIRALELPPLHRTMLHLVNHAATLMGWLAGVSLGVMAVISLDMSNLFHMTLSFTFFPCQIMAFLLDTLISRTAYHRSKETYSPREAFFVTAKSVLCLVVSVAGCFLLFMFATKESGLFDDPVATRRVYVIAEYVVAIMCLGYAALIYPVFMEFLRPTAAHG